MPLALDALLLFVLAVPVVMHYRILPIEGTPYWLFGLLFLILLSNTIVSVYPSVIKKLSLTGRLKNLFLALTLMIVVGGTVTTAIVDRSKTAPAFGVHDIILQQEAAMRFLLEGKNPYKETYFGTLLENWHYAEMGKDTVNPALYHFVMPPWYLLFPFPFYFLSLPLLGFFDGRMPLLATLLGLLIVVFYWFKDKQLARLALTITALNPATIDYFIEGRSDVFALFWLILSLFLLEQRKVFWSSFIFGLALWSKQTIWFVLPFYVVYLWVFYRKSLKQTALALIPALAISFFLVGPFLLWDTKAFLDSVVFYLSGTSVNSYPISGYGLGMLFYEWGIIKNLHAYYPFIFWQSLIGLPILIGSLWWLMKKPVLSRLLLGYGVTLMIFWYLSRYLNDSHLGFLSGVFALGILKDWDEKNHL